MSDEIHNMNQFSSSDPHSPAEQVRCLLCQSVPDQYISLDCKDDFCLVCLAQKYHEMKQSHEVLINDYNNYEIYCPACKAPTLLDEASINALEETLNLMKAETKKNELFNEIIMEESAENYNADEGVKGEEKKSLDAKYNGGLSFLARNSLEEEQKDGQSFDFFKEKEKNSLKTRNKSNENEKIQEGFDFKPKKPITEPVLTTVPVSNPIPEKKEKTINFPGFNNNNNFNEPSRESNERFEKYPKNAGSSQGTEPRCPKHRNEITNLFCFTCESACICVECLVEGVHRNHNVKNVAKGAEFLSEKLNRLNDKVNQKLNDNQELLQRLESEKKSVLQSLDETTHSIQTNFKELRQRLQQKEQEILREYDQKSKDLLSQIDQFFREIQQPKDLLNSLPSLASLDKMTPTAQINYYNNYSDIVQKVSRNLVKRVVNPAEIRFSEIKKPIEMKTFTYLLRTIESLNQEKISPRKIDVFEMNGGELSSFNRKLRMESEYLQETNENNNIVQLTQTSSFLGNVPEFKLPRRATKSVRNPFKNIIGLPSEKSSMSFKNRELKIGGDLYGFSSKGWSRTPTHSNLEQQQKRFEKQKEFFFSKF